MQSGASFAEMRRLIVGHSVTIAISAIAELGIADHLAAGPRTAAELARLSGTSEDFLRRVLRYLSSEGVFEERAADLFALTERGYWLRSDVAGSLRPRAVFIGGDVSWTSWGHLTACLRRGISGTEVAFGQGLFDYLRDHPEAATRFNTFMADQTAASVSAVLKAYDFSDVSDLVDIGGGRGALVAGLLQAYAGLRGILFDQPSVVAQAQPLLERAGIAERCRIVGGDFFAEMPAGADLYVMKFVLHDWSDDDCLRILANCREAMAENGRLLIVEHILPLEPGPHPARFMDINMLVMAQGGRERSETEFQRLLEGSGFALYGLTPTEIGFSVLDCRPVS